MGAQACPAILKALFALHSAMALRTCCSHVVRPCQRWILPAAALRPVPLRIRTFAVGSDIGVNQLPIKAQEDSLVMDVAKRVGDYCKRGEAAATQCAESMMAMARSSLI